MTLLILILVYLLSSKLSEYTTLLNTVNGSNLHSKLIEFSNKIDLKSFNVYKDKLLYSKLFYCKPCNSFWLSLLIYTTLNVYSNELNLIQSLLIYLINKTNINENN